MGAGSVRIDPRWLSLLIVIAHEAATAGWLSLCPVDAHPVGPDAVQVLGSDGRRYTVSVVPSKQPACRTLPLPDVEVLGVHPASAGLLQSDTRDLMVSGTRLPPSKRIAITKVAPAREAAQPSAPIRTPVPLKTNLLEAMSVRTYGVEERVRVRRSAGTLTVECRGGTKAAGLILESRWYVPQSNLSVDVTASGAGVFRIGVADLHAFKNEALAVDLGVIDARRPTHAYPLTPASFNRAEWHSLSIACPNEDARLSLESVKFTPRRVPEMPARSTWIWEPSAWQQAPAGLLAQVEKSNARAVYVSVPVESEVVRDANALASFVRAAARRNIQVWAVDGDPRMVLPAEQPKTLGRLRAYLAYNRSVEPAAALRGVQFDVEHYLIPGYHAAEEHWDRHYLEMVKAIHQAAGGLPVELAVPFWWSAKPKLLESLAPWVSGLVVMNYQTDPANIYRSAVPFLDWGVASSKSVRIALEAGPVEAESHWTFTRAARGDLWLVKFPEVALAVMLAAPKANPHGPAFALARTHQDDPRQTSFHGNVPALTALLPDLEDRFAAWPRFGGMALHGFVGP